MANGLSLLAHWSVGQKRKRVSSVQLCRSVRTLTIKRTAISTQADKSKHLRLKTAKTEKIDT